MPNTLLQIQPGRGKPALAKSEPQGPILVELQKYVEQLHYTRCVPLSFEANEQGALKLYFPAKATVTRIRLQVDKPLAATDAGTVLAQDSTGANLAAAASIPLSSAFGTEATITPVGPGNATVAQDGFITLTTAKTTAGGKVLAYVECTPSIL